MSFLKTTLFVSSTALLALGAGCSGESFPDMNEDGTLPALEDIAATVFVQGASAKAVMRADGDPAPARVGVLWRRGMFPVGAEQAMIIQELPITGSFPDNFTIELSPQPPANYADDDYSMGSLVVLSADAVVDQEILLGANDPGAGGLMPRLTTSRISELGIVSMPPVYVTHVKTVAPGEIVIDYNFSSEYPLAPGYHLALMDGEHINRQNVWYDCLADDNSDDSICGADPNNDPNWQAQPTVVLTEGDTLAITVGGVQDLINTPADAWETTP